MGWPCWEGNLVMPLYAEADPVTCGALIAPIIRPSSWWHHSDVTLSEPTGFYGHSAAGVVFYTGSNYPPAWRRSAWFSDFQEGWLMIALLDAALEVTQVRTFRLAANPYPISLSSNPHAGGDVTYLAYFAGELRQIKYGNPQPIAMARVDPPIGSVDDVYQFISDGSFDPQQRSMTFAWTFGDGATSNEANPRHKYASAGQWTASLTVTVSSGDTQTMSINVRTDSFAPRVTLNPTTCTYNSPGDVTVTADLSQNPSPVFLEWDVQLVHNAHYHPYVLKFIIFYYFLLLIHLIHHGIVIRSLRRVQILPRSP